MEEEKIWSVEEIHSIPIEKRSGRFRVNPNMVIWYKKGKLHRENGPAIEHSDGDFSWYKNGGLHRLDGPAILWNGQQSWFIENKECTEEE